MKYIKKNKIKLFLPLILLCAFLLRAWRVTEVPPSLYWDEVSQGYNAYSLLTTGHDEHREFLPVARLIAFGDYKAPVYTYLIVPFMALVGKNELAVRLPSVVFGSLMVLFTYFLTRELFYRHKLQNAIALFSAFFLAISPWHIQLSRAAFEGNIATFFTILGAFLFLFAVRKKSWAVIFGILSFVLAFYSFNSHRVFIPLLTLLLTALYWKEIWEMKKKIIIGASIGVGLLIPFLIFFMSPESRIRFQEVNIFSDLGLIEKSNELQAKENNSLLAKTVHNRRVIFGLEYIENYFEFYNPDFLFFEGDINTRFSHRNNGQLYLWQLPLILIAVYQIAKGTRRRAYLIFGWILLAPIAAATARETPHALRAETFLPMFSILTAVGLLKGFHFFKLKSVFLKNAYVVVCICVLTFSLTLFMHNYFIHFPKDYSHDWQYGYKEMVRKVNEIKDDYTDIYVTRTLGRPYIYFLFYTDISPQEFWADSDVERDILGLYNVRRIGNIHFVDRLPAIEDENVLVVGDPEEIPDEFTQLDTIHFLNGEEAFEIAEK